MTPTSDELAKSIAQAAGDELHGALKKIAHCLAQLSDEQTWWRSSESMNSIANLMLHLAGNLRQWIVAGVGGADDTRDRPREFAEKGPIPTGELFARLESTVADAEAAMATASAAELQRNRRIQGFEVTGIQAIFETVAHFRGHTQEIVHLARVQLGDAYQFQFVPATPEQGVPQS